MRLPYDILVPDGLAALERVHAYVLRCGLEKSLVDLAFLRASQLNGCAYCIDLHTREALGEGVSVEKLMLVPAWREAGGYFSTREQAALAWAEVVTFVGDSHVSDEAFLAAQEEFADKELADLTLAIGLINVYNRMAITFRRAPASLAALSLEQAEL